MSEKLEVASASIRDINRTLETMAAGGTHSEASRMEALKTKIPKQYHCFLNLFSEAVIEELPRHRAYDHHIPLKDGFTLCSVNFTRCHTWNLKLSRNF
jgi:hypothetical protein